MDRKMPPALPCLAALTLAMSAGLAAAGTATIDAGDGNSATFEYRDDMLRINNSVDAGSYAVVRDGSLFTVSLNEGQPIVIDAGSVMKGVGSMQLPPGTVTSDFDGKVLSFEDTGEDETVAGIKGDVYEVRFEDADGQQRSETLVLSTDKRVREFNDAMFSMMSFASGLASTQAQEQGDEFRERLDTLNAGVLRYGNEMRVSSISGDPVALERFELPAQPMNLEGLGAMLGNLSKQAAETSDSAAESSEAAPAAEEEPKTGLFSSMMGALSGQGERQQDRVGDAVDDEIDEQTDETVDKAIGKAFGKLFGRDRS